MFKVKVRAPDHGDGIAHLASTDFMIDYIVFISSCSMPALAVYEGVHLVKVGFGVLTIIYSSELYGVELYMHCNNDDDIICGYL